MYKIKKRGQFQLQIFTYIIALIVITLILFFGYRSISKVEQKGEQVILIQFTTKLKDDINSLSHDAGSVSIEKYRVPSEFDEICFVDLEEVNPDDIFGRPLIKDSVGNGVQKNVFFSKANHIQPYYVEDLKLIYPYFACIQTSKTNVEFRLAGLGDGTLVQPPPNKKYCQNAQSGSICRALDIFWEGYQKECCQNYRLCC